ncbi:hypothetical protein F5Y12DRAFT_782121 [Xylaria sp. FL1777]|nr:hypothetical protein F5Y12DRAFT_782121 [Xylaria sp. FL1777]
MAGKSSTQPADAQVLAAMMDDLGNHRMEELARDNDRKSRHRPAVLMNAPSRTRSAQPKKGDPCHKSLSEMYHAAIKDGLFDDDDAAGVSGLDPLDSGNAHRINRFSHQPFRQLRNEAPAHNVIGTSKKPKYDPSQPTYSRKGKLKQLDPNANHLPTVNHRLDLCNSSPRAGSLGGIGPDGSEETNHAGCSVSSRNDYPLVQPVQAPDHGHRGGGPPSSLLQMTENEVGDGHGKPSQPLRTPMNGTFSVNAIKDGSGVPRSASRPTTVIPRSSSRCSTSESQPAASQSSTTSQHTSPRLSPLTTGATTLYQSKNVLKITGLDAQYDGENKSSRGQIIIYELRDAPVIRGDIRELLEVLPNGSGPVRSNPLRFSGIDEAQKFISEANFRRDQYAHSHETIYTEATVELSPAQYAAINKTTVQPAEKATHGAAAIATSRQLDTSSVKSPRPPQPISMKPKGEKPKLAKSTTECHEHNVELRPHTPSISVSAVKRELTPPTVAASIHERIQSCWDDNDLISFSPAKLNYEQPVVVDTRTLAEAGNLSRLPSAEQVEPDTNRSATDDEHEAEQETKRLYTAEEATKALRNVEVTDAVHNLSRDCLAFLRGISADYTELNQKSTLLSIALDTPYLNAAFATILIHLVEKDEFLKLSLDDQKRSLAFVYTTLRHGNSPIIRSQEEILALRSGEEACPEAIKELNDLIGGRGRGLSVSRPTYRPERKIERSANGHQRSIVEHEL